MRQLLALLLLLLVGCTGMPKGVQPVKGFKLDRYLGTWYEVARLDHSFERGLTHVSAEYSLRNDGGVRVVNRGYSPEKRKWKQAEGKAYFVENPDTGYLKVSFFGPFYGSYIILDLDEEGYKYSLVCGPDRSYLWILARTPDLPAPQRDALVAKAKQLGFETRELIHVEHRSLPGP